MNGPDDRDELLAKLQAIDKKPTPAPHPQPSSSSTGVKASGQSVSNDNSLNRFLAELDEVDRKTQHLKPKRTTRLRTTKPPQSPNQRRQSPATNPPIAKSLEQLALFAKEKLEARAQERQLRQQRVQQEDQAKAWLAQLDAYSDDGFWFEQFAENYDSRLQAAIDFLNPKRSSKGQ